METEKKKFFPRLFPFLFPAAGNQATNQPSKGGICIYRRVCHPAAPERETPPEAKPRAFPAMTLTVDEMAEELHVSRPTAYELVKKADFPAFRIGSRIIVNRKGLQEWIDKQCQPDPAA